MSKIVYLRTANQPRTDLALIEEQLRAIHARLDLIPTRGDLARAALGIIFCTAGRGIVSERPSSAIARVLDQRNPIEIQGIPATIARAMTSAPMYGQIRHNASSGETRPIAQAP